MDRASGAIGEPGPGQPDGSRAENVEGPPGCPRRSFKARCSGPNHSPTEAGADQNHRCKRTMTMRR